MKTKQEQIEEMAQNICGSKDSDICQNGCCNACGDWKYAERAYSVGYRKASDVIDEFVERLKEENEISLRRYSKGIGMTAIFRIADEMKFELFKQQEDNMSR